MYIVHSIVMDISLYFPHKNFKRNLIKGVHWIFSWNITSLHVENYYYPVPRRKILFFYLGGGSISGGDKNYCLPPNFLKIIPTELVGGGRDYLPECFEACQTEQNVRSDVWCYWTPEEYSWQPTYYLLHLLLVHPLDLLDLDLGLQPGNSQT